MITAVDANVLLDILVPDAPHARDSELLIESSIAAGTLVVSEPVLAEISGRFSSEAELQSFLFDLAAERVSSVLEVAFRAGSAWTDYTRRRPRTLKCPKCGRAVAAVCSSCGSRVMARQHVIADFLIGAHALVMADRLLTRDRGFYSSYFPALTLA